jgi:hypothetical protein
MTIARSYLKIRVFGRDQGNAENQPAGILKYVEDLIRGLNADIGRKDHFEMASNHLGQGCIPNSRCMDNLLLNRMNSRQGIVKKEQDAIFIISIG